MTFGGIVCSRSIGSGPGGNFIGTSASVTGSRPKYFPDGCAGFSAGANLVAHPVQSTGIKKSSRTRFLMGLTFLVIV
jgi:hypothetical protein